MSNIPQEFFSEYEGRPFQSCTRCGESLADVPEGYQVCKLYRGGEVIVEYAICHVCHTGMIEAFSDESRRRLEEFHADHVALNLGRHHCAVCRKARGEDGEPEFSVTGAFCGQDLHHELMMCGECRQEMEDLLSEHTRKVWEDFVDENLPGVPAGALSLTDLIPA